MMPIEFGHTRACVQLEYLHINSSTWQAFIWAKIICGETGKEVMDYG